MRILCVIDGLGSGGAQRQLVGLAIGFKEKGHIVTFLTYHKDDFYLPHLINSEISVFTIEENNLFIRLLKIISFIRKGNFDSVLAFLEKSSFACEIARIPWKKWTLIVGERNSDPRILQSFKSRSFRWFHFFANYVVSNSKTNISLVKKANPLLSSSKLKVIYNLVDLDFWKPKESLLANSNKSIFTLIVVARHAYQKNLMGLVNAVHQLKSLERKRLRIEWYGAIEDNTFTVAFKKIEEYKLNDIFKFTPASKLIRERIYKADAMGLFSFFEGLPNALCEGMALGKPIIASDISDNKVLIHEGKGGFLFDPTKPKDIAVAIKKVMGLDTEELKTFGVYNRIQAEKLFNPKHAIDSYLNLMERDVY